MISAIFGAKKGLSVGQSLGAFPLENGDISPLYVLFSVSNPAEEAVTVEKAHVRAGRGGGLDLTHELGGEAGGLPLRIPSRESATLWMRAKDLSQRLSDAGHTGSPKLKLVLLDDSGSEHTARFRLRVDEYLQLKDE